MHLEPAVDDDGSPDRALEVNRWPAARAEQSHARMAEQFEVQVGAPRIARDVGEIEPRRVVGEIEQRQARAVCHDDVVILFDAVLLGENQLAKSVLAAHPVAQAQQRPASHALRGRSHLRGGLEHLRAHVGVLGRRARSSRAIAAATSPRRAASPFENAIHRLAERLAESNAIAR